MGYIRRYRPDAKVASLVVTDDFSTTSWGSPASSKTRSPPPATLSIDLKTLVT
jgi:hypothetical protein